MSQALHFGSSRTAATISPSRPRRRELGRSLSGRCSGLQPRLGLGPKRGRTGEKAKEIARCFDAVLGGHDARRAGKKRQAPQRKCVEEFEWNFDRFTHRSFLLGGCAAGVAADGSSRPWVRHFFEQKCTVISCP